MSLRPSLRLRAAVGIAAIAIIIVGIQSIVLFYVAEFHEDDLMDQIAREELEEMVEEFQKNPAMSPPHSQVLTSYIVRDAAAHAILPAHLRELPDGFGEVGVQDADVHFGVRTENGVRFYVVYDVTHNEERIRELGWLLVLGVAITAALATALGYWAAGFVVRPVASLARRVDQLGPDPPPRPFVSDYIEEEIRILARAFDGYLAKMTEFIQREQEFTANISHELRTPLTAIRTSCELLLQEPGLAQAARQRIEAIDRAVSRLTETARSLLFLARDVKPLRLEEVSIKECVAESAEPVQDILARKGVSFENAVDSTAVVRVDRAALMLVIDNLLRNAALYTEQGFVRVTFGGGCLTIEDTGPGIDAAELPRVIQRHNRGGRPITDDGLGLGLAIVKRICERFDWRLDIASTPGCGTRASLGFPLPTSQNFHAVLTGS